MPPPELGTNPPETEIGLPEEIASPGTHTIAKPSRDAHGQANGYGPDPKIDQGGNSQNS